MTPQAATTHDYSLINNALTQIHFNATNYINERLTQLVFSVGEIEMHSVANFLFIYCRPFINLIIIFVIQLYKSNNIFYYFTFIRFSTSTLFNNLFIF